MSERIAIVGVGQTEFKSRWLEISQTEMVNLAVRRALENAQITMKDIDAVIIGNMELFEGNYLVDMWMTEGDGAFMKSGMKVQTGGSTGSTICCTVFDHAATGLFNTVLGIGFEKQDEGSSDAREISRSRVCYVHRELRRLEANGGACSARCRGMILCSLECVGSREQLYGGIPTTVRIAHTQVVAAIVVVRNGDAGEIHPAGILYMYHEL